MSLRRVVIVGAGAAGIAAAQALRGDGYDGALTMVGDEPHPPYDRPPLAKDVLAGSRPVADLTLCDAGRTTDLGLDLRPGTAAVGLDVAARRVQLADGGTLPYDGVLVTTGVRPRQLPGTRHLGNVHVLRTVDDAQRLRAALVPGARLVVVGAGYLGCEAAAVAATAGVHVTLVEPGPTPLPGLGGPVGALLASLHRTHGVDLRTGGAVRAVRSRGNRAVGVTLADGAALDADAVLLALGSTPATGWLAGSGLTTTGGVRCDAYCAAAPGVYAAGDVARWWHPAAGRYVRVEHRTNATAQGIAAAHNLLAAATGGAPRPYEPVAYAWSDQYGRRIQILGDLTGHDGQRVVDDPGDGHLVVAYRRAGRVAGVVAVDRPRVLRDWRPLVDRPWPDTVPPT
ncbi:NAD(P)/FAD-dependent oxidoreductase [Actinocatenispora rupis]|uniref:Pyridine nucleotide-disulfide oxidoreductase n=1 Tax=Actinocatenispora rupis TaxID=519421 RepID=A0A8J3J0V5_9ACTN|nr:FAD-dependent oxidoreductase [Actinocatenispora rupis]GID12143.1 pyridine nucleotide-disulfide oxidoreductase [Actinocatenispora rupis]